MIPDTPRRTANHAEQLMAIEVFSELLAATDPRELGQRLTEQLRELTGARTVALLAHPAAGAAHALIHVCPARRAPLFGEAELGLFCSHCSPAPLPHLAAQLALAHPLRDVLLRAGIETLVRIPLRVRDEVVSTLVLLDLPEPGRIAEAVTIVTRLAPVIALALKNAFAQARIAEQAAALQSQTAELECRVAERTAALEEANRSLAASRLSALNLMEDAVAARRRAEETSTALQHSEALFRRTFDEAPIGAAIIAPDGIFRRVNTALCHFLGYLETELIGRHFGDVTFAADLEESRARVQRLLRGEIAAFEQEKRYVRKDGTIVWGRVSVSLVRDAEGRPLHLAPLIQDITAHKMAEEALRRSEQRYATTLAAVNDGLWEWNVATGTAYFSPLYYTMLGYRDEAFVANYANWRALVHPEDVERVEAELRQSVAAGLAFSIDLRMKTATGEWRWVCTRGNTIERDPQGQARLMVGTLSDITPRKQAERDLEQFFSLVPDMVCIASDDGRFLKLNDAWSRVLGYTKEELMAVPYNAFLHPEDLAPTRGASVSLRAGNPTTNFINRYRAKDGTYRWLEWNATPLRQGDILFAAARDITEHRLAEEAIRESEVRYRTLADSGQALIWTSGLDKKCNYFNQPWLDFTGRPLEQELGDGWTEGVHPEDFERCVATYVAAFEQRAKFSMDYRIRHRNGEYRWIQDNGSPRFDSHGAFLGYIGHCLDITERKRAEQALQESEEKFAKIFHAAPAWIGITDLATATYLDINDEALRLSGFSREEVIGRTSADLGWITAAERARLAQGVQEHGRVAGLEMTFVDRAGRAHIGWLSSEFIRIGGRPSLLTIIVDITARKRAEEERRQSHELLAKLAAQVPGVVYQYQLFPDGRACFPYASPGMRAIYELDPEEVRNDATPVLSRLHPEDTEFVMATIGDSARTLEPFHCEFRVILPHQGLRWRLSDAMPERLPDGGTLWYGIISDITERRRAEEALHASLREKEALLKEVHHRVKNNLQIISSLLRLQAGQIEHPATVEVLQDMQGRIRSMALLHETLYRSGNLAQVDLADYLESICTQLLRATNRRGTGAIAFDFALAPILLDATQAVPCGLLVNELAANCLKHAFPGGRPGTVHVRLQLVTAATPPLVELSVADDGIGLPPDFDLAALHSLGLQLVSDLAQQLRGTLAITPGPGMGAVFTVSFPCPSAPR